MTGKKLRIINRTAALILSAALLSVYGCNNKGKTIDPDFYPTAEVIEETEIVKEEQTTENKTTETVVEEMSEEGILVPEKNTFREGKYVYNPVVIPEWVLKTYENNPKIIRVAKMALWAIDNCATEIVIDEETSLTEEELEQVYYVLFLSNPLTSVVGVYETEEKNVYRLSYFPQYDLEEGNYTGESDPEEARKQIEDFKDYVTETINNNLTSDMSDTEIAAILYKQIVSDIKLEVPDSASLEINTEESAATGEIIKGISNKKYSTGLEFSRLYAFFLTQLHIECRNVVGTSGFFTNDIKDELAELTPISYYWDWQVLLLDGEYYNCDIALEAAVFAKRYLGAEGAEPDMEFFGMSDKKRNESYKVGKTSVYFEDTLDYSAPNETVPNCPTDLDFH
jgi:hypothetical protein